MRANAHAQKSERNLPKTGSSLMRERIVRWSSIRAARQMPWILTWREAEPNRHFHQVGERVCFHLLHDFSAVSFDRDLTDPELVSDLFIQKSRHYEVHDLVFARRE